MKPNTMPTTAIAANMSKAINEVKESMVAFRILHSACQ
jgi:hypothetical protein